MNIILKWTHTTSWLSISLYTRMQTTSKKHLPWTCVAGAFLTLHTHRHTTGISHVSDRNPTRARLTEFNSQDETILIHTIISFRRNSLSSTSRSWWRCNVSRPKLRRRGSQSYLYPPTSVTYSVVNFAPRRDSWLQKFSLAWRVAGVFSTWFV